MYMYAGKCKAKKVRTDKYKAQKVGVDTCIAQ